MNKKKGVGNPNEIVLFMCGAMFSFILTRINDKSSVNSSRNNLTNRETLINLCNEAMIHIQSLSGEHPSSTEFDLKRTNYSIEKQWAESLSWKKWKQQRVSNPEWYV
mmetsp:Transcript_10496/g.14520  ORF Transcript_10496/g.14520 Transcript_10496/m.14520 type:complete len:107 (+) Transcript_10496:903-1223(+)